MRLEWANGSECCQFLATEIARDFVPPCPARMSPARSAALGPATSNEAGTLAANSTHQRQQAPCQMADSALSMHFRVRRWCLVNYWAISACFDTISELEPWAAPFQRDTFIEGHGFPEESISKTNRPETLTQGGLPSCQFSDSMDALNQEAGDDGCCDRADGLGRFLAAVGGWMREVACGRAPPSGAGAGARRDAPRDCGQDVRHGPADLGRPGAPLQRGRRRGPFGSQGGGAQALRPPSDMRRGVLPAPGCAPGSNAAG